VFSSNGDRFVFHDRTGRSVSIETNLGLDAFPSPADLWARYRAWKGLDAEAEQIVLQDYFDDGSGKVPRYYQVNAVNAAIEAIAKGRDRVLLVTATGTGKTYTAFQIIWRLWKAGRKKRILFLADRNVLIDQTMVNDFRPFGAAMAKLSTNAKTIERQDGTTVDLTLALDTKRRIDTAFEVYLGLYQAITGPEERQKLYREFSPGFFDLIVIDECHRGSAAEDSAWREILTHFSGATQIGLTAPPKEPNMSPTPTISASRFSPIRLCRGSATGSWRPTRSSRFTSTETWKAIARNSANSTVRAPRSRTASTTPRISTGTSCSTTARC
jgi:type I restriction enzyme, R subunit